MNRQARPLIGIFCFFLSGIVFFWLATEPDRKEHPVMLRSHKVIKTEIDSIQTNR